MRDRGLDVRVKSARESAYNIRMGVLEQGEAQGEGYVGQALGAADLLAVAYTDQMHLDPADPQWDDRDRFLLSIGHYALALYSALAEVGTIPREELTTYAADGSRLPMSGMSTYTPGMEISGGSLGHGLGVAVGTALGLRHQGKDRPLVINLLSDGELDEGSTWEAAMSANHFQLGNLIAVVDMNGMQADGRTEDVLRNEPQTERWESFGWHAQRVDGNDVAALIRAFDAAADQASAIGRPHVIIADTVLGKGVPMLESREKLHFMKIAEDEWPLCKDQLTTGHLSDETQEDLR
ncbi:transketolase [Nesterenkonia sp. CL21]|uniref:transketolase n=1 Tax=Nesterenkonia sp. CL21 TaxID=3064894 RepID=UPI00287B0E69|nr:transketolase [Nesterenkonia sp. CL21]MDS2173185.1 transketolase [Nesterenkonia sp. CL21]